MTMRFKKLTPDAMTPRRAHVDDAGLDLGLPYGVKLWPHSTERVSTEIAVEIPAGHVGLIFARSSVQLRGVSITGVIDSGYRGPVGLIITNHTDDVVRFNHYIAQLVIVPCITPELELVDELSESDRMEKGFGSSDKGG